MNKLEFFSSKREFDCRAFTEFCSYHWEAESPYRPRCFFKLGVVDGVLSAVLKAYEKNPRAVFENRDDPIYMDSCLEFFVKPLDGRDEYINIECNSKGAFLCEYGKGRENRVLLKDITALSPSVVPFKGNDQGGDYWGVEITLSKELLTSVYNICEDKTAFERVFANFYKCGDECDTPHYIAFSPVSTLPPGFHNPQCFAEFIK